MISFHSPPTPKHASPNPAKSANVAGSLSSSATQKGISTEPAHRLYSKLQMRFCRRSPGFQTTLQLQEQTPPLRVVRAFPQTEGSALVHLNNISGGVLGGDHLTVDATLDADTRVLLTTTGSTRVYRHRAGLPASTQLTTFSVGQDALLEYLPDSIIPYADARYHQSTRIDLQAGAGLFYWEVVTPGRVAHGEHFAYDQLRMDLDIYAEDRPIALERVELKPNVQDLTSTARLGKYSYVGTFYVCRVGSPTSTWVGLEKELDSLARSQTDIGQSLWGVSRLTAHGVVVRVLSQNSAQITNALPRFWEIARRKLYGTTSALPRKIY